MIRDVTPPEPRPDVPPVSKTSPPPVRPACEPGAHDVAVRWLRNAGAISRCGLRSICAPAPTPGCSTFAMGRWAARAGRRESAETLVPVDVLGIAPANGDVAVHQRAGRHLRSDRQHRQLSAWRGDARRERRAAHLQSIGNRCDIPCVTTALLALGQARRPRCAASLPTALASADVHGRWPFESGWPRSPVIAARATGEDGFEISPCRRRTVYSDWQKAVCSSHSECATNRSPAIRCAAAPASPGTRPRHHDHAGRGVAHQGIQKVRRIGGERAGGFPGAGVILGQLDFDATRSSAALASNEGRGADP